MDMMKLRLSLLPEPERFTDLLNHQIAMANLIQFILPEGADCRRTARTICAYSLLMAEKKKIDEAEQTVKLARILGCKIGAETPLLIELLVGEAIVALANEYAIEMYRIANLPEKMQQAENKKDQQAAFFKKIRNVIKDKDRKKVTGALDLVDLPGSNRDTAPARNLDYILYERLATSLFLLILTIAAFFVSITTGIILLRHRNKPDSPKLLFIGWRRMAKIISLGTILPVAVYIMYSYLLPTGARDYSFFYSLYRVGMEFLLVYLSGLTITMSLATSVIKQRAVDAGIPVPPKTKSRFVTGMKLIGIILAGLMIGYIILWHAGYFREHELYSVPSMLWFVVVILSLLFCVLYFLVPDIIHRRRNKEYAHFNRTYIRSLTPVLAGVVVVTSLLTGFALDYREKKVMQVYSVPFFKEIEYSNFKFLKEHLQQEYAREIKGFRSE
jgi:hypothetical protein